jgi:hypothetical protein
MIRWIVYLAFTLPGNYTAGHSATLFARRTPHLVVRGGQGWLSPGVVGRWSSSAARRFCAISR